MILSILASMQHLRVPSFNSAKNSYFGLAAGKGLKETITAQMISKMSRMEMLDLLRCDVVQKEAFQKYTTSLRGVLQQGVLGIVFS